MPKSPSRIDRFMPSSPSISSFHIKSTEFTTTGRLKAIQKSRAVSGVNLNIISNEIFPETTNLFFPTNSVAVPIPFDQAPVQVHLPPALGAMARVARMQQRHFRDRGWDGSLATSRGSFDTSSATEKEEGPEGEKAATENQDEYNASIAGALGVKNSRILLYSKESAVDKKREFGRIYAGSDMENLAKQAVPVKRICKKKIVSHIPYRILDAPGLRNDFYANLVAWSAKSGQIAVGLLDEVFLWTEHEGAAQIAIPSNYGEITCLVFSCNNVLSIGHRDGTIIFFDLAKKRIAGTYVHVESPVCFLSWFPNNPYQILVGDESGNVVQLELKWGNRASSTIITKHSTLKGHTQQICAITFSPDESQLAIGGNDNLVTVWNIQDWKNPTLVYRMPHKAAVKALAFCPWCPSLLATGGGSQDRTIRFWHTRSGTLIKSFNVKGQVTSLVWSRHYRQLAATFGFADSENPLLLSVYSFPKLQPLIQVPTQFSLRVLSSVLSPDHGCICVATNDETVRFYELWSVKNQLVPKSGALAGTNLFGSDIIEMIEEIDKQGEVIR